MILIQDYNPQWPLLFQQEKALIRATIGKWIQRIEHIGSTAVPNLAAKPIIDIMIGTVSLKTIDDNAINRLRNLGYEYLPQLEAQMPFRRFFHKRNELGQRTFHIHLVELSHDFWRRQLLFRDYLRTHADEAKGYEQLKRQLASQFTDTGLYAIAKTDFILAMEKKAEIWDLETVIKS